MSEEVSFPMPSSMTAAGFVEMHGETIVKWLAENVDECACDEITFGTDEKLQRGETIDAETVVLCRRCYVPVGLHAVRPLHTPF